MRETSRREDVANGFCAESKAAGQHRRPMQNSSSRAKLQARATKLLCRAAIGAIAGMMVGEANTALGGTTLFQENFNSLSSLPSYLNVHSGSWSIADGRLNSAAQDNVVWFDNIGSDNARIDFDFQAYGDNIASWLNATPGAPGSYHYNSSGYVAELHGPGAGGRSAVLNRVQQPFVNTTLQQREQGSFSGTPHHLSIARQANSINVYLDGNMTPYLSGVDPQDMFHGGKFGVRLWGSGWIDNVTVEAQTPRVHLLSVGSVGRDFLGNINVHGGLDAAGVHGAMSQLSGAGTQTQLVYDLDGSGNNPQLDVYHQIKAMAAPGVMRSGDTFVFFYSGHGVGGAQMQESLLIQSNGSTTGLVTDENLTRWLNEDPVWREVNKLFVLDCCNAGGFGSGDDWLDGLDPDPDPTHNVMGLPRTALIALAGETESAGTMPDGRGWLAVDLEAALALDVDGLPVADADNNGLSFEELTSFLHFREASRTADYEGYLKGYGDAPQLFSPVRYTSARTDDFGIVVAVPEPASIAILAVGGVGLLVRRRRRA